MAFRLENRVPPPIVGACIAALMYGAARLFSDLDFEMPWRLAVCALLFVVGAGLDLAGLVHFLRARTTVNPLEPAAATSLVTGGLYRFTRNPMYLGLALLLLAWGVFLANVAALLGVPAFVLYMNRFQIAPEERALEARFGAEYSRYCARVRRWI
jgi:protein-S-isoprenylcysteine O-methyltransferase Ste14